MLVKSGTFTEKDAMCGPERDKSSVRKEKANAQPVSADSCRQFCFSLNGVSFFFPFTRVHGL